MVAGVFDLLQVRHDVFLPGIRRILLQDLAVADDRVQRRAQLVAHVGQEFRFHLVGAFGVLHRQFELLLALLQLRDVGVNGDRAAVVGAALADAYPASAEMIFERARRRGAMMQPLGDPVGRGPIAEIDKAALHGHFQDPAERRAGLNHVGEARIELDVFGVAQQQPVVGVVQSEPLIDAGDGVLQGAALVLRLMRQALSFLCQPLALVQAVAEQHQRLAHIADLVIAAHRDRGGKVASTDRFDGGDQGPQRPQDGAQDHHGEQQTEQDRAGHHADGDPPGPAGIGQNLVARGRGLLVQFRVQPGEQFLDLQHVLAGPAEQRIADHPLVAGVGVHRPHRGLVVGGDLRAQLEGDRRPAGGEAVDGLGHTLARRIRVALREGEQADRKVRLPVAQILDGAANFVRAFHQPHQPIQLERRSGGAVQRPGQIEIGSQRHQQQRQGEQHQPDADRYA